MCDSVRTLTDIFLRFSIPMLHPRFADLKKTLVKPEDKQKVTESYNRLLKTLEDEVLRIHKHGTDLIPEIDFQEVRQNGKSTSNAI